MQSKSGRSLSDNGHSISAWHPLQAESPVEPCEFGANEIPRPECQPDSYRQEWQRLFEGPGIHHNSQEVGLRGQLRSSRFRSIYWKLYLRCLPEDRSLWLEHIQCQRNNYKSVKEKHITNPHEEEKGQDLSVNNPLSQEDESPWNKFFQDKELKMIIQQDVTRTFPEILFFQDASVQEMMADILFCFARENEHLLYRQGMHELLAPILFVLHCDHQALQHASDVNKPTETLCILLDPKFIEHDAYSTFSKLMETAEPWFSHFEKDTPQMVKGPVAVPFARPQDGSPPIAIVTKLNRINDTILKKHDPELHVHLGRLEIAPQIYGIRWVRLLFGREFALQDLLALWDAIFADGRSLSLVDYIFVAMLQHIRDALLSSNYQMCLGLLMKYPPAGDIHHLVRKALFLRDPKQHPRPANYLLTQNLEPARITGVITQGDHLSRDAFKSTSVNKVSAGILNFTRKLIGPPSPVMGPTPRYQQSYPQPQPHPSYSQPQQTTNPLQSQQPNVQPQTQPPTRILKSESVPSHLSKGTLCGESSSSPSSESLAHDESTSVSPPSQASRHDGVLGAIGRSRQHSQATRDQELQLQSELSRLQGHANELHTMCCYCAQKMENHLVTIEDAIFREKLERADELLVALAGLKQIKDILRGTLTFNQSELEGHGDIAITDNHYCADTLQAHSANGTHKDDHKGEQHQDEVFTSQTSFPSPVEMIIRDRESAAEAVEISAVCESAGQRHPRADPLWQVESSPD
uniref:TBC1 domain family member 5 n=1 Tax=Myxine glutinosa TaxID=7769 RepID=UPI00358FAF07